MGLGIVLIFWAIALTILAGIGAAIFGGISAFATKGVQRGRRALILASVAFPFACLAWAGAAFVFQAIVNEEVLDRDLGLGDTWHCPLPNGYALMMIDVTDQGWVYNPKTQPSSDGVFGKEDAVDSVRAVQIAGRYILGGYDTKGFAHLGEDVATVDRYFLLDTQTGKRTEFPDVRALQQTASKLGIQLHLEPINSVYSRYRFTWFDVFAAALTLIPPMVLGFLLVRWILRVRRSRPNTAFAL
jgi:hypothetical protein